ncbi:MAG: restriction endonuclease [Saprospiraceae bacterium]
MKLLPKREYFFRYTLQALTELGGSGTNDEINKKVISIIQLPEELLNVMHKNTNQTEFEYQMAWVRTMLKNQGLIENSKRGVWAINQNQEVNFPKIKFDRKLAKKVDEEVSDEGEWKQQLLKVITESLSPNAFERLVQRILREKGFIQVEVKGRTGDGGIDGIGIAKINGILSFHIIFQCKRYKGKVGAKDMRDFRGAMVGRTDKGLFITTGTFTRDAIAEATRDGAPVIDLIDGDLLADKLKELGLGVTVEFREEITIDENWFKNF